MEQAPIVDVQKFLNQHPFSAFQWQIFGLCFMIVLLDGFDTAAIGYIAPSLIKGMERRAAGARAGFERCLVRARLRRVRCGTSVGPAGSPVAADRICALVRCCLPGVCLLGDAGAANDPAIPYRTRTGCCHAQRRDDDERVLPRRPARNVDQSNVLRLSTRRRFWGLFGGLDDPAIRLAKRTDAGWYRPLSIGGVDAQNAAGVRCVTWWPKPSRWRRSGPRSAACRLPLRTRHHLS